MTKYKVEWTEHHSTILDADDENAAMDAAAEYTKRFETRNKVSEYRCTVEQLGPVEGLQTAAAERAATRERCKGQTPDEMCRAMSMTELMVNVHRGGVAAIAEMERRAAEPESVTDGFVVGGGC